MNQAEYGIFDAVPEGAEFILNRQTRVAHPPVLKIKGIGSGDAKGSATR